MKSEHKREIEQLWWVAERYSELVEQTKNKNNLRKKDLQTTVAYIAERCKDSSGFKGTNKWLMLLNTHLASCAVRLSTIDERLGISYTSMRWYFYQGLAAKKDKLRGNDITANLDKIVHLMLRHNVAHEEYHSTNPAYKKMQDMLMGLKIGELYKSMRLVKDSIKEDIKKHKIRI